MERILIIEDDSSIRKALTMGLISKKYEVDNAKDGFTGIYKGTEKKYDVLVTDLCLPDYSGIQVIEKIKKCTPEIVPIVITGRGSMESTIEAIRVGVVDYLEKPVSLKAVENAIVQGLKKRSLKQSQNCGSEKINLKDFSKNIPAIVHQINNPLAVINASILLARRSITNKKRLKHHLSTIFKASQQISATNKSIMNLGKTLEGNPKPIKANTLFNNCLLIFKDLITLNEIEINTDLDALESIFILDPYNIEQIFSNLILNAMDAMGGYNDKHLEITGLCDKKAGTWSMDIQDSGCGISNADLKKIFLPYFTTKNFGTGLGLSVVRQMVKNMSGEIKIKSMPGQGSKFTITFPLNGNGQDI